MTRLIVFSDTHGDISLLNAAMAAATPVDGLLHLGDYGSDARRMAAKLALPFHAVCGNCDAGGEFPREKVVRYEKAALLLTHGDRYADSYALSKKAEAEHCDAALFGHTHQPYLGACGHILILNPGSLSRPRFGSKASFAVLQIDQKDIQVKMISL